MPQVSGDYQFMNFQISRYTHRQFAPGKRVLEVKLRKKNDGLLKHFNMGKTRNSLDSYRFDALISDRQVLYMTV